MVGCRVGGGLNLIQVKRKKSGRADVGCKVDGGWEAARAQLFGCRAAKFGEMQVQVQGWHGKCRGRYAGVQSRRYGVLGQSGARELTEDYSWGLPCLGSLVLLLENERKGRACLALGLFHLLCKDQISNGGDDSEKMEIRMRNDGDVLAVYHVCVT